MVVGIAADSTKGLTVAAATGALSLGPMAMTAKSADRIVPKEVTQILLLMGNIFDLVMGIHYIRKALVINSLTYECISIVENMGLMGLGFIDPLPGSWTNLKIKQKL